MAQWPQIARRAVPAALALSLLLPGSLAAGEAGPVAVSEGWRFRPAPEHDAKLLVNDPADLANALGRGGNWGAIKPDASGWYAQGFNPPRAGWFVAEIPLPAEWAGLPLVLEIDTRCRFEAVYADGVPVGARERPQRAGPGFYLLPPRGDARRPLILALRLDAPDVAAPGLAAPPVIRPATLKESITPGPAVDGKPQHRPDGLNFFPNAPVQVANLLINVAAPSFGGSVVRSEAAAVTVVAAPADRAPRERKLEVAYLITDDLSGTGIFNGDIVMDVPPEGVRRRIPLPADRAGAFAVRLLVSSEGEHSMMQLHYAVFPEPPADRQSPLGLIMTAEPETSRLSGAGWLVQPGVLSPSSSWVSPPAPAQEVVRRLTADARAAGYRIARQSDGPPDVSPPDMQLLSLPSLNTPGPIGRLKRSYLDTKARGKSLCLLMIPPEQRAQLGDREAEAAAFSDIFCSGVRLPIDFKPESFVPEFVEHLRAAKLPQAVPQAPAVCFSASYQIRPSHMIRSTVLALACGARQVFWNANEPRSGAWIRGDASALPPLPAFACMAGKLGRARYLGRAELGDAIQAYAFHNGAENVLVVWKSAPPRMHRLPAAPHVEDAFGAEIAVERIDNMVNVIVSDVPIYLRGFADADLPALLKPEWTLPADDALANRLELLRKADPAGVIVADARQGVVQHGTNKLSLELGNLSGAPVDAAIALELPPGWSCRPDESKVTLAPADAKQSAATVEFELDVPADAPLGEYSAALVSVAGETRKVVSSLRLRLSTAVGDLAGIRLSEVYTSAPSIAVPVENPFERPVRARVQLNVSDWSITPGFLPVELAPGERGLLRFLASGRLPVVGSLQVAVTVQNGQHSIEVRRRVDISQQRFYGVVVGRPEVQSLQFDGRRLSYKLSKMTIVSVRIYDGAGKLLRTLDSGWQSAGPHHYEWTPEREPEDGAARAGYRAEVRAGMDVFFDRSIGPGPEAIFAPRSITVDKDGGVCILDGRRAVKFSRKGDYLSSELPAERVGKLAAFAPLPNGCYVGLRPDQLLLLDHNGAVLKAQPETPRAGGGIEPGNFRRATTLDVSPAGIIFVADAGNHRVQRFNSDLSMLRFDRQKGNALGRQDVFGCPVAGTGAGEFTTPTHLAAGPDGGVAVADATGRLQVFDKHGARVGEAALPANEAGALAFDGSALYVAAADRNCITRYDIAPAPAPAAGFGENGTLRFGALRVPALAADGRGGLIVCDAAGEVTLLDAATGAARKIFNAAPPPQSVAWPAGIDVDDKGTLFVTDPPAHSVHRISAAGEIVWSVPDFSLPIGIYDPSDIALTPGGSIYVLDNTSPLKRLMALDSRGQPAAEFRDSYLFESEELNWATVVDRAPAGAVWAGNGSLGTLLSTAGSVIRRDTPAPNPKARAGGIQYLPWHESNARGVILADARGREIARKGALGTGPGRFAGCTPGGIAARAGAPGKPDYVYYADTINHRIVVLRIEWGCVSRTAGEW